MPYPEDDDSVDDYFVSREEIEAWIRAEQFSDLTGKPNVSRFRRSLGEFTGNREISEEGLEALYSKYPRVMMALERGEQQMESKKMNEVDGPYDTQARVDVKDPVQVIKDAWDTDLNVSVTRVPGEPRMVSVKGPYEHVMGFLTQYLNMSSAEADIACKGMNAGDHVVEGAGGFDRFMDNILLKETKQVKQPTEDTPQRVLAKRHRELTTNRITYRSK